MPKTKPKKDESREIRRGVEADSKPTSPDNRTPRDDE